MPEPLPENTLLEGRYRILQVLRSSPEGSTYLALDTRHPDGERQCALREYFLAEDLPDRAGRAELLYDALEYLEGLTHPNLARMLDLFSWEDRPFGVFEHVPGDTLQEWCSVEKVRLTETQIYEWSLQLADALTCLHQHHPPFIMGEVDTRHIVVGPGGQLKIVGFGLRRLQRPQESGTLPPLFSARRELVRGDIQALGRLIVTLLSRAEEPAADAWAFPSAARMTMHRVISRCLSHESGAAYQTMREALDDLCRVDLKGEGLGPIRRPAAEAGPRWWEPAGAGTILPIKPTTGRLHFVSARRSRRRRAGMLAAFVLTTAAVLAWAAHHAHLRAPIGWQRRGAAIYAIAGDFAAAVNPRSMRIEDRVPLPDRALFASAGARLALLATHDRVLVLDTGTDRVVQTFDTVGGRESRGIPQEVAVTPDDSLACVLFNGELDRVDLAAGALATLTPTGIGPGGVLALAPNGSIAAVGHATSPLLEFYNLLPLRKMGTLHLPGRPGTLCLDPRGGSLYVTLPRQEEVVRIAPDRTLRQRLHLAGNPGPTALACTPDGRLLFVGLKRSRAVAIVAAPDLREVGRLDCGGVPGSMVATASGRLWIATWGSDTVSVFDTRQRRLLASVALTAPIAHLMLAR